MPTKVTWLFHFATDPAQTRRYDTRTAGWSESFWSYNPVPSSDPSIREFAAHRATLLPESARVSGFRISDYDFHGNKLTPKGSRTGLINAPGQSARCDVPQMALNISWTTHEGPGTSRTALRGIPDSFVLGGEYAPNATFTESLNRFCNLVRIDGWRFLGRDLTLPAFEILQIAGNVVTLSGNVSARANLDYVRFLHCRDSSGNPIQGSYLVTAVAGNSVTLGGYTGPQLTRPSGKMRLDRLSVFDISGFSIGTVAVRKVGRPFVSYRGRQSKRQVM